MLARGPRDPQRGPLRSRRPRAVGFHRADAWDPGQAGQSRSNRPLHSSGQERAGCRSRPGRMFAGGHRDGFRGRRRPGDCGARLRHRKRAEGGENRRPRQRLRQCREGRGERRSQRRSHRHACRPVGTDGDRRRLGRPGPAGGRFALSGRTRSVGADRAGCHKRRAGFRRAE